MTPTATPPASETPLTWTELLPEGVPPSNPGAGPPLVYDPQTQQLLALVTGILGQLIAIWSFSAGSWTNVTPSGNLTDGTLTDVSATYDVAEGYVLLYGLVEFGIGQSETWADFGGDWEQLDPVAEPNYSPMTGVVYDSNTSSAILLTAPANDSSTFTWAYESGNWTELTSSPAPPVGFESSMTFDNASGDQELVLFEGEAFGPGGGLRLENLTWAYRGADWVNLTASSGIRPPTGPGPMTYDPVDQEVVQIHPGDTAANGTPDPTWVFAGGSWSFLDSPTVPPLVGQGTEDLAYDAQTGYCVLVGDSVSDYSDTEVTQTWILNQTVLGPPPLPILNITPSNLSVGGVVKISAAASGGYGALAYRVAILLPGAISALELRAGSWNFTPTSAGTVSVVLGIVDQAGRRAVVAGGAQVSSSGVAPSPVLSYLLLGGAAAALAVGVSVWYIRRRGRRRTAHLTESDPVNPQGPSR